MPSSRIDALESRLDATFGRAESFRENPTALADYARYLCVLVSGFIERAVDDVLHEYAEQRSHPSVSRYVQRSIRTRNLNEEGLFQILARFDAEWPAKLQQTLSPDHFAALNSIRGNRNRIAHGESVTLGFSDVQNYYTLVKQAIRALADVVNSG